MKGVVVNRRFQQSNKASRPIIKPLNRRSYCCTVGLAPAIVEIARSVVPNNVPWITRIFLTKRNATVVGEVHSNPAATIHRSIAVLGRSPNSAYLSEYSVIVRYVADPTVKPSRLNDGTNGRTSSGSKRVNSTILQANVVIAVNHFTEL